MGLNVTDTMLIKAQYELSLLQEDDAVYDIIETIILDEAYDEYTKGYLMAKLDEWSESMDSNSLMQQFVDYITLIKG